MKTAFILTNPTSEHQRRWNGLFAEGLKRHGWKTEIGSNPYKECDLLCMWSVRRKDLTARQKKAKREVCILERGYIDDRFKWTSVSFGGALNGRATFHGPFEDASRWQKHFTHLMQPWQERNGYALILGQVPSDNAVRGVNLPAFYEQAQKSFQFLGMQTKFRRHPNLSKSAVPITDDLAHARCAVVWNSNSSVDAVLAGVPTIAMDEGSMSWDVTGHELGVMPPTPDRTKWAHAIAWKQWAEDELASGYCWDHIKGDL